jgi:ABC-type ATPase involved in cell division
LDLKLVSGKTAVITASMGKGKSSLVELITGRKKPISGDITVFGNNLSRAGDRTLCSIRRRIGGVGGIFQPLSEQTVYENMSYPLMFRKTVRRDRKTVILESLSRVNLMGKKNERVGNLSQGEKMLLMLARATVANQPLLLIDEPLAGLDPDVSMEISERLKNLSFSGHSMLILTSGQTALSIPDSVKYTIVNGKLS